MAAAVPVVDFLGKGEPRDLGALPQKTLARMAVKLYLLGSLAWDYADTCCDIAAQMRIGELKPLCRAVRELKREYDRFRNRSMRDADLGKETELGLLFEQICQRHFTRLNHGVASGKAVAELSGEHMMLVRATHQAMAVLDTMRLYASECDAWIRERGVRDRHSILSDHFPTLSRLVPQFGGDAYDPDSEARRLTARILLNEIRGVEIYDDNGKL